MNLDGDDCEKDDLAEILEAQALLDSCAPRKNHPKACHGREDWLQRSASALSRRVCPKLLLLAFVLAIVVLLVVQGSFIVRASGDTSAILGCGSSQAEARTLGCSFDPMSFSWLPPPCHDAELTADFASIRSWQWYAAAGYPTTIEEGVECFEPECLPRMEEMRAVSNESVWAGEHDVLFVTREYHLWHCAYMWRKLHRAVDRGGPVDGYARSLEHTNHCSMMLMIKENTSDIDSIISVKFPSCLGLTSVGDPGRPASTQKLLDEAD